MADELPELMTRAEVAELLRVSVPTLKRWDLEGVGPQPVYLRPRVPRYRGSDVTAYLSSLGPRPEQEDAPS